MSSPLAPLGALLVAFLVAAAPADAQRSKQRRNDPSLCTVCEGNPDLMTPAGIVSHGVFPFGTDNTKETDIFLATSDIRWIETEHVRIGFGLGSYKVSEKEKKKLRAELIELQEHFPDIEPKKKILDPWYRVHLFALRVEKAYDRFLELIRKEQRDFPEVGDQWMIGRPYMGEGPHLGQKEKYEILIVETPAEQVTYLREHFGLLIKKTQRWNVVERDALTVTMHIRQGQLRVDTALHGHVVFNLAHCMLDGYKHYSYDTPLWIHEGLAHFMEREVSPRWNSFDSTEGSIAEQTRKEKWIPQVKKMINGRKAPRMAELMNLQSYAAFELEHHYATWSMTKFLVEEHANGYACLNDELHGLKDAEGYPDGSNMRDTHRKAFQTCLGMSYAQFDQAWKEWALGLDPGPPR
ncbi:MAG: hypothetical protein O7B99_01125 [Planctomycetota bacterium]|nr:hypothetical protein [Planctomycetota bacterium]